MCDKGNTKQMCWPYRGISITWVPLSEGLRNVGHLCWGKEWVAQWFLQQQLYGQHNLPCRTDLRVTCKTLAPRDKARHFPHWMMFRSVTLSLLPSVPFSTPRCSSSKGLLISLLSLNVQGAASPACSLWSSGRGNLHQMLIFFLW